MWGPLNPMSCCVLTPFYWHRNDFNIDESLHGIYESRFFKTQNGVTAVNETKF